jgi:lysophospholipase L1-like esterase
MPEMNRRTLLTSAATFATSAALDSISARVSSGAAATVSAPATVPAQEKLVVTDGIIWHDVREWGIEGKGFADTERYFDRLPARARNIVRDAVWKLSHNTAGMSARFEADTPAIYVRYEVTSTDLAMPHMSATGKSGLDLYARHEGAWRWLATHSPKEAFFAGAMLLDIIPCRRAYQINLPLYNGVKSLEIGVPTGASFTPIAPRTDKPILFYGTSITQGGCASRPGMAFVSILGRRLGQPILNFGFSGNGLYELEVGRLIAELDPAIFAIDCVGNSTTEQITARTEPLIKLLRERHPLTPILLLDRPIFPNANLVSHGKMDPDPKNRAQFQAYQRLLASGMKRLYYRDNRDLIGSDSEGTVDGSHPNDLGMMRYAEALEPELRRVLAAKS